VYARLLYAAVRPLDARRADLPDGGLRAHRGWWPSVRHRDRTT
jgi:hypothetical protein